MPKYRSSDHVSLENKWILKATGAPTIISRFHVHLQSFSITNDEEGLLIRLADKQANNSPNLFDSGGQPKTLRTSSIGFATFQNWAPLEWRSLNPRRATIYNLGWFAIKLYVLARRKLFISKGNIAVIKT